MAGMLTRLGSDLKLAARSLMRARAFTLVCVVSLGVGMTPVILIPYGVRAFSAPPAHVRTQGLVELITTRVGPHPEGVEWSYPDFVDLRDAGTGATLVGIGGDVITVNDEPVGMLFVSDNYFETIGVPLARGAGLRGAAGPSVVVSDSFWKHHQGSDPDIVGKTLILNRVAYVVVGVAPERFAGHFTGMGPQLYGPLELHPRLRPDAKPEINARADRASEWVHIIGRLSPGVSREQASAAVAATTAGLARQYPSTNEFRAGVAEAYVPAGHSLKRQLVILQTIAFSITGMVLLVVCLNISGMVQVRSAMRERELSVRQALGASRRQLILYQLSEAIILAALGTVLASLVIFNVPSIVPLVGGENLPQEMRDALRLDLRMVAFCAGLSLLTSLLFGWLPAARFSRPVIIHSLKDDAGIGGLRAGRAHRVGAALQVAIAVPLMVTSGICLDRVRSTAIADLGFDAEPLYAVSLRRGDNAEDVAASRLRAVRDDLARTSGVASVTLADAIPLDFRGHPTDPVALKPEADVAPRFVAARWTRVGDDYFGTMGISLLRGRGFTADDRAGAPRVTVIAKALAARLFPNADAGEAIGKTLLFGADPKTQVPLTIVGVTGDFPTSQMNTDRAQLLLPLAQSPTANVFLVARSAPGEAPQKMIAALENAARQFDPNRQPERNDDGVAMNDVIVGASLRKNAMDDFLSASMVSAGGGSVILMLAALGIYGVVGLMVTTRTREIAVRVALGASRRRVVGMILFDVVKLVSPGVALGLLLTVAFMKINADNMGIPLSNVEYFAYVAGAAVAVLVAVIASLVPARRAASVQPMVAMRST
jgi:predicted permease